MIVSPSDRVAKVETYYFATKLAEVAQLNAQGKDIINLGIGSPDMFPHEGVLDTLKTAVHETNAHKYQSYSGIPELKKAFGKFYQTHFNVSLDPNNEILPLIGSKEGIMHISMAFLNDGDEVLIPDPGYPTYASATKLAGGVPVTYDLRDDTDWLPDFDELESKDLSRVKLMWINYPHMPTGQRATKAFYKELIAFAQRNKILICHDNPYSFILNDEPMSIMSMVGAKECAVELVSLSKSHNMAGWRIGALVCAQEYKDVVLRFKSNMDSGMFRPMQVAACEALAQGKEWFDSINAEYRSRREKVWQIMDLLDVSYDRDAVGMFVWGKPRQSHNIEQWLDEILYDASVFLTPGFIFGKNGSEYIRISLCADHHLLDSAISRIKAFITQKEAVA